MDSGSKNIGVSLRATLPSRGRPEWASTGTGSKIILHSTQSAPSLRSRCTHVRGVENPPVVNPQAFPNPGQLVLSSGLTASEEWATGAESVLEQLLFDEGKRFGNRGLASA